MVQKSGLPSAGCWGVRFLPAPRMWLSLQGLLGFPNSKFGKNKARRGKRAVFKTTNHLRQKQPMAQRSPISH